MNKMAVIRRRRRSGGGGAFTPAANFADGADGAWYDPSDDAANLASGGVRAGVDDPVAVLLDKSQGLAETEVTTFGTLDQLVRVNAGNVDLIGGEIVLTDAVTIITETTGMSYGIPGPGIYRFEVDVKDYVSGGISDIFYRDSVWGTVTPVGMNVLSNGTNSGYIFATDGTNFRLRTSDSSTYTITDIRLYEILGNHLSQPVVAARPIRRQEAGGAYYLELDGVDDEMTGAFTPGDTPLMLSVAFKRDGGSSGVFDAPLGTYNTNSQVRSLMQRSSPDRFGAIFRANQLDPSTLITEKVDTSTDWTSPQVYSATFAGLAGYFDVRQGGSIVSGTNSGDGTEAPETIAIGKGRHSTGNLQGKFYGGVAVTATLTDDAIIDNETWLEGKVNPE